jgi:RNA-binding protein
MLLTTKQKAYLRALAHKKRVVVSVGNAGLTPPVLTELRQALAHHELIKIKLPSIHRDERAVLLQRVAAELEAQIVQSIGRVGVLYRQAEKTTIELPKRTLRPRPKKKTTGS